MHVEVIVLYFVRTVLGEVVNHNLRELQVGQVSKGVRFAIDNVDG